MATGDKYTETNLIAMLSTRMGWNINEPKCSLRRWVPCKVGEQVAVFIVKEDKAVLLHDELGLYPSDALVTKVRIIENGEAQNG